MGLSVAHEETSAYMDENWDQQRGIVEQPLVKSPGAGSKDFWRYFGAKGSTRDALDTMLPDHGNSSPASTSLGREIQRSSDRTRPLQQPSFQCKTKFDPLERGSGEPNSPESPSSATANHFSKHLAKEMGGRGEEAWSHPRSMATVSVESRTHSDMKGALVHRQYPPNFVLRPCSAAGKARKVDLSQMEPVPNDDPRLAFKYPSAFPLKPTMYMLKHFPQVSKRALLPDFYKRKGTGPPGGSSSGSSTPADRWASALDMSANAGLLGPRDEVPHARPRSMTYSCEMRQRPQSACAAAPGFFSSPFSAQRPASRGGEPLQDGGAGADTGGDDPLLPRGEAMRRAAAAAARPTTATWTSELKRARQDSEMASVLAHKSPGFFLARKGERRRWDGMAATRALPEVEEMGKPGVALADPRKTRQAVMQLKASAEGAASLPGHLSSAVGAS